MSKGFVVQESSGPGQPFFDVWLGAQEHWAHTADKAGLAAKVNAEAGYEKFKLSEACYVCGYGEHAPKPGHNYWPESEALAAFNAEPQGAYPSMSAAETLDPREAVYS